MRLCGSLLAVGGLLVATASPAFAQEPTPAAPATPEGHPKEIVRETDEAYVQGTCATPFEAMLQLLWWVQEGEHVDKAKAAACFDPAGAPADELPELAYRLKRTLDARGDYIDVPAVPKDPDYKDSNHISRWRVPDLEEVEIVKKGGKWVFSAATIKKINGWYEEVFPPALQRVLDALPSWMHSKVFGQTKVWQLTGVVLLILIAFALRKFVVYLIRTYVRRIAGRVVKVKWVENAAGRVDRPIGGLAMAGVFYLLFPWLQFSVRVSQVARIATGALAIFSLVWLGYRLIDVLCDWLDEKAGVTDTKMDDQLVPMLRKVLKVFAVIIGGIFILQNLSVNVGSLLAGLGLGGLAFALAAKDSIANIFGSVVIFVDKPFQIGDWVIIGSVEGTVEEVGFRTTRVRTFYNSLVTVPNAQMTNVSIDNFGKRQYRRYKTTLGLTYDTPPEKVQAFCEGVRAIIDGMPGMRKDTYLVEFQEFGAASLNILLYCFMDTPTWNDELRTRTNLNLEIMRLAENLGVGFAFPTQTIHVETMATPSSISSPSSMTNDELKRVIESFARGGGLARPRGVTLSRGYDPGTGPAKGSDADG